MSNEVIQETTPLVECSAFHRGMSVLEASLRNTEDAGTAGRSASLELDAECGHHGDGADRREPPLVHQAGRCTESIQVGASANDRGFCAFGKCSRRKGRCGY